MRKIIFFLFLIVSIKGYGINYYFSSLTGDDSRTTTQAQNQNTPWLSITKLNSVWAAGTFNAGDSLLLKRGETFQTFIGIKAKENGIIIGAFGAGSKPIISGYIDLSFPTHTGSIWTSNESIIVDPLNLVTLNGSPIGMGRYPQTGYLSINSHTTSSITSTGLSGQPTWNTSTSQAVIKLSTWLIAKYAITGQGTNKINFTNTHESIDPIQDNWGFFIQDDPSTLLYNKGWYLNRSTSKLQYFSSSGAPTGVRAANVSDLFTSNGFSNITLYNLDFEGANDTCINIAGGSKVNVINCILNGSMLAISSTSTNSSYSFDSIYNALNNAIRIKLGGDNDSTWNNYIYNTSIITGTSGYINNNTDNDGGGITTKAINTDTRYNVIRNVGLGGTWSYRVNGTIVKYNWVDSFNINRSDIGGIYFTSNSSTATNTGRQVIHNIVTNGLGTNAGTDNADGKSYCFYFDVGSQGIVCDSNTAVNGNGGFFVHKGANITYRNNTSYNMSAKDKSGLQINHEKAGSGVANTGFIIKKNIWFAKSASQRCMYVAAQLAAADVDLIGVIDSNYYIRPLGDSITSPRIIADWASPGGVSGALTDRNLSGWKTAHSSVPYDVHSISSTSTSFHYSSPTQQSDSTIFIYNTNTTNLTMALPANYKDVFNNIYHGTITLQPFTSAILFYTSGVTPPPPPGQTPYLKFRMPFKILN